MQAINVGNLWKEYELIDSGNFHKLERFGNLILSRPEPQAVWEPGLSIEEWEHRSDALFVKQKGTGETGEWKLKPGVKDRWFIEYSSDSGLKLKFRLGLTAFKHIGLFPEQASNWEFIYEQAKKSNHPKVLNLFAYTGAASLAANIGGADVVHIDSVKQVVTWANDNMELNGLNGIRWIVDDAMKFVKREVRRGNKYEGIILDPPAYGRGPEGEKWVMEERINELMFHCSQLLYPKNSYLVLNLYSMGLSSLIADSLITTHFGDCKKKEFGEFYFSDHYKKNLPLGTFYRMMR